MELEIDTAEQSAIEQALDFSIWRSCDELVDALSAYKKLNTRLARLAVDEVCEKVAGVAADIAEGEHSGD